MAVQWYPGHMAKTRRLIGENIKLVDVVVELCDARIPASSRNPDFEDMLAARPRLIILNKCDMADETETKKWIEHYAKLGVPALACDSMSGAGIGAVIPAIRDMQKERIRSYAQKGQTRSIKIMVVGVPNVGKSSFINRISGRKSAKVEDRPGVTRDKQWVRLSQGVELLDTPGILWPKFEDEQVGYNLAFTGAVKDDVVDIEEVASFLVRYLFDNYKDNLCARYKIEDGEFETGYDILCEIGARRGFLQRGAQTDTERTAKMVLDEFRAGKIGRMTIEKTDTADRHVAL